MKVMKYQFLALPAIVLFQLVLIAFFTRFTLLVLFIPVTMVLMVIRWRWQPSFNRAAIIVVGLLVVIVGIPFDVQLEKVGHISVKQVPIVWGLPTLYTLERIKKDEVIAGGCIVPLHPAKIALVITY
jgi:uncharacterized membrane protein